MSEGLLFWVYAVSLVILIPTQMWHIEIHEDGLF